MIEKPKVSVLIPAYNHGRFLNKTIHSVLNQTFKDFELLVADDGSTDNTESIIKDHSDDRIVGFFFKKNLGTVRTLNYLLKKAKGEYIAVLGSDDFWCEDKLKMQVEVLENDATIAACFTVAELIDSFDNPITDRDIFPTHIFNTKNMSSSQRLLRFFNTGNHLCHSSVLIRRSVHDEIGDYNIAYRQLHDFDLWVRLLCRYNIHVIEDKSVKYRFVQGANNISNSMRKNDIRVYNEAAEIFVYMFENIRDEDFIEAFSEHFINKNAKNKYQIACEKYFFLKTNLLWGSHNTEMALRFLLKKMKDENIVFCLEEEYGYELNKIYDDTATFCLQYPREFYIDSPAVKSKIDEIYNSTSWRITKPLRNIAEKISKKRKN